MKKQTKIIVACSTILTMLLTAVYFYSWRKYDSISDLQEDSKYTIYTVEYQLFRFNKMHGEYPLDVLHNSDSFDEEDSVAASKFIQSGFGLRDYFAKNTKTENELIYYPLYNRVTGRRESFIFIGTGIDGKLDNVLTYFDTLYIDSWWKQLKLYNTNEVIANRYFNCSISTLTDEWKANQGCRPSERIIFTTKEAPFSFFDYLWGAKDSAVQLDMVPEEVYSIADTVTNDMHRQYYKNLDNIADRANMTKKGNENTK